MVYHLVYKYYVLFDVEMHYQLDGLGKKIRKFEDIVQKLGERNMWLLHGDNEVQGPSYKVKKILILVIFITFHIGEEEKSN